MNFLLVSVSFEAITAYIQYSLSAYQIYKLKRHLNEPGTVEHLARGWGMYICGLQEFYYHSKGRDGGLLEIHQKHFYLPLFFFLGGGDDHPTPWICPA